MNPWIFQTGRPTQADRWTEHVVLNLDAVVVHELEEEEMVQEEDR